jgi:hypothetical protein
MEEGQYVATYPPDVNFKPLPGGQATPPFEKENNRDEGGREGERERKESVNGGISETTEILRRTITKKRTTKEERWGVGVGENKNTGELKEWYKGASAMGKSG